MNDIETNAAAIVPNTSDDKKPWVTPAATVEQVSDVTKVIGGGSGDGTSCHT